MFSASCSHGFLPLFSLVIKHMDKLSESLTVCGGGKGWTIQFDAENTELVLLIPPGVEIYTY